MSAKARKQKTVAVPHGPDDVARPTAALMVLCTGLYLIGLDMTMLNVALPSLQQDLRTGMSGLQWVADGYALALACGVLAAGRWSDAHGRRRAFRLGLALSAAASICGALADSTGQVVAARFAMGAGAALLMPATLSLIGVLFPRSEARRRAIAVWGLVFAAGCTTGPAVGGLLVELFSWRAGFWINVPLAGLALLGAWKWVPESHHPQAGGANRWGMATATAVLLALVWAIIEAPVRGWSDPWVLASFAAAVLLLAVLIWGQKHHPTPIIPRSLWQRPRFTVSAIVLVAMFFAFLGTLFVLTLYLQTVLGYSPLQAGFRLLPLAVAVGVGAVLSVPLGARYGDTLPVAGGMLLFAIGFLPLTQATLASGYGTVLSFEAVTGVGAGLAAVPATAAIMGAAPAAHSGTTAAVNDLVREVGGALGIAVMGTLLTNGIGDLHHVRSLTPAEFTNGLHACAWTAAVTAFLTAAFAFRWLPAYPRTDAERNDY